MQLHCCIRPIMNNQDEGVLALMEGSVLVVPLKPKLFLVNSGNGRTCHASTRLVVLKLYLTSCIQDDDDRR